MDRSSSAGRRRTEQQARPHLDACASSLTENLVGIASVKLAPSAQTDHVGDGAGAPELWPVGDREEGNKVFAFGPLIRECFFYILPPKLDRDYSINRDPVFYPFPL